MICAYLLHAKLAESAAQALDIYAKQRSLNFSGITVASQKRSESMAYSADVTKFKSMWYLIQHTLFHQNAQILRYRLPT